MEPTDEDVARNVAACGPELPAIDPQVLRDCIRDMMKNAHITVAALNLLRAALPKGEAMDFALRLRPHVRPSLDSAKGGVVTCIDCGEVDANAVCCFHPPKDMKRPVVCTTPRTHVQELTDIIRTAKAQTESFIVPLEATLSGAVQHALDRNGHISSDVHREMQNVFLHRKAPVAYSQFTRSTCQSSLHKFLLEGYQMFVHHDTIPRLQPESFDCHYCGLASTGVCKMWPTVVKGRVEKRKRPDTPPEIATDWHSKTMYGVAPVKNNDISAPLLVAAGAYKRFCADSAAAAQASAAWCAPCAEPAPFSDDRVNDKGDTLAGFSFDELVDGLVEILGPLEEDLFTESALVA
jgi:hypothetical protein